MISLDNLRTVLNAIKRTLDSTKQDKLIAGKNINIAEDGKTISATQVIEVALAEQTDGSYTADITFAQLKAEVESGKQLMLIKDESRVFVLNKANDNAIEFLGADSLGVTYAKITAKANEVWEVESALTPNTDNISKISSNIGVLANLTTDDKTHLVAAINEVNNNTDLALLRIEYDRANKQDKLIAGENITISADGKTISAAGGGGSVPKPLTYDYMPEGYPTKTVQTTTLMEEQEVAFRLITGHGIYVDEILPNIEIVEGQTYTVKWDGTEYECVGFAFNSIPGIGNLSIMGAGDDTGEPFLYSYKTNEAYGQFVTPDTSASHTIGIREVETIITPMAEEFLPPIDVPTKTSQLENDAGYLTLATLPKYEGVVE